MGGAPRLVVVGLGPSVEDLVPPRATAAMAGASRSFLRTRWHPAAAAFPRAESFDDLYDTSSTFAEVYRAIVDLLVEAAFDAAGSGGYVAYAVPGSPSVAEATVELAKADGRVCVEVVPAPSFLDLAWERLGIDPMAASVRLVDGQNFSVEAAGERGPLLVGQCWSKEILSEVKLAVDPGLDDRAGSPSGRLSVVALQRLGCADESVIEVAWEELDRAVVPDHMTSLYIPVLEVPAARELIDLVELVRTLRERCPWDRKQTHSSLTKHLVEEAYEVLDAIAALPEPRGDDDSGSAGADRGEVGEVAITVSSDSDAFAHLEEELGDLLFQVLFHARLAAEEGHFDLADVARTTHDKLVGRHPHVFGDVVAESPEAVLSNWEQIKKAEKGRSSIMEGIPASLPALAYAYKVQKKAASVGFDWPDASGPSAKVTEELAELTAAVSRFGAGSEQARGELGDLLFSIVNLARHLGTDPEVALRLSASSFRRRFEHMESAAASSGRQLGSMELTELENLWEQAKGAEKSP